MTEPSCETVCMAAMAIADGYQSELSPREIEAHLASCMNCRREVEEQQVLSSLLASQERRQQTEDVWHRVEPHLTKTSTARVRNLLMVLGVLLLGYRIAEMIPDRHFGLVFKFIPVLLVIAAFTYLRENPFKINTELRFEGE